MIWSVAIASKLFLFSRVNKGIEPVLRYKDSAGIDTVTVEISARRVDLATLGRSVLTIKNSDNGMSLASALQREGVYLKSYGVSGSATISRRGADPTQTQVLWNNLPICNPMLGMGDFTLLMPVGMSVKLVEGGNATLLGSGSVGGSIAMNNDLLVGSQRNFNQGFVSLNAGSFGEYGISAAVVSPSAKRLHYLESVQAGKSSAGKWSASATVAYNHQENNFKFQDPGLMIIDRLMTGSSLTRKLARTSIQYRGNKTQWVWHSEVAEVNRGLGLMLNSYTPLGTQFDRAIRTVLEANSQLNHRWKSTHRVGWIRDFMEYTDGNTVGGGTPQRSIANTTHVQSEWYYKPNANTLLLMGGDFQAQQADISHYVQPVNRILPAIFVAWYKAGERNFMSIPWHWQRVATARYEAKERIPTASISWVVKPSASVASVKFNVHSTFRRPTLNDLYWFVPGGNRLTLTYEQGAGTELAWQRRWTKYGSLEWLVYGRYLDKPIVWVPAGAFWMPTNLQGGGTYYGGQSKTKAYIWVHPTYGTWIWVNQWERNISWVKQAINSHAYHQIFIPNLSGKTTMVWQKKNLAAEIGYAYTGKRYIQTDNKKYLPGFGLVQAEVSYQKAWKTNVLVLRLEGDNLLNITYQTVPNRPMPGASVRVVSSLRF